MNKLVTQVVQYVAALWIRIFYSIKFCTQKKYLLNFYTPIKIHQTWIWYKNYLCLYDLSVEWCRMRGYEMGKIKHYYFGSLKSYNFILSTFDAFKL